MIVFLTGYGSGGDGTTVGVPSCCGAVLAGRETTAIRLTSTYFGANSTVMNVFGGSESLTLSLSQLPTGITSSGSNSITVTGPQRHTMPFDATLVSQPATGGGGDTRWTGGGAASNLQFGGSNSISVTSNNTSGAAHRTVQPTLIADCNVMVVP